MDALVFQFIEPRAVQTGQFLQHAVLLGDREQQDPRGDPVDVPPRRRVVGLADLGGQSRRLKRILRHPAPGDLVAQGIEQVRYVLGQRRVVLIAGGVGRELAQLGVLHRDQPHLPGESGGGGHHGRGGALAPAVDPAPELNPLRHILRNLQLEHRTGGRTPAGDIVTGVRAQAGRAGAGDDQALMDVGVEAEHGIDPVFRQPRPDPQGARVFPLHPLDLEGPAGQLADAIAACLQGEAYLVQRRQRQVGERRDVLLDPLDQVEQRGIVDAPPGGVAVAVALGVLQHSVQHPPQGIAKGHGRNRQIG